MNGKFEYRNSKSEITATDCPRRNTKKGKGGFDFLKKDAHLELQIRNAKHEIRKYGDGLSTKGTKEHEERQYGADFLKKDAHDAHDLVDFVAPAHAKPLAP
ncbi:MAG: hypothetical protein HY291_00035 [Planctomycetes bacterium]|nr:hypothetical protein [Planctomycetota bacterium]